MEHQEALNIIIELVGWGGLIILSPFLWRFCAACSTYLIYKIFPVKTIYIEHKHDGIILNRIELKLDSNDPLVSQLSEFKKGVIRN